jgi:general secretion pathway protein C
MSRLPGLSSISSLIAFTRSTRASPVPVPLSTLAVAASALLFALSLGGAVMLLREPLPAAAPAPAAAAPLDTQSGRTLFGVAPVDAPHDDLTLLGTLALDPLHAAAVVASGANGTNASRVVSLHGKIDEATTLVDVRPRSIVVERHGVRREIALSTPQSPFAFVR